MKTLALINDESGKDEPYPLDVDDDLADLLGRGISWKGTGANPKTPCNFDATFAALVGSPAAESMWFREHLALRGVNRAEIEQRLHLQPLELAGTKTSISFRQAVDRSKQLATTISGTEVIGVRHLMAAYAVLNGWHLVDFLRLRVDRRAWCRELGSYLAKRHSPECAGWLEYRKQAVDVPATGFAADTPTGVDLLSLDREVETLARLAVARATTTPVSIGVFGAWGAGKSFFMRAMRDRVDELAAAARANRTGEHHADVVQIEFNAWHYSEGNLPASFVDHIFRNLRQSPDEDEAALRERSRKLVEALDDAKVAELARAGEVAKAERLRDEARAAVAEIDGQIAREIAGRQKAIDDTRARVDAASAALAAQLEAVRTELYERLKEAPIQAVLEELTKKLDLKPFTDVATSVNTTVAQAIALRKNAHLLVWGGVAAVIALIATAIQKNELWIHLGAGATALGAALATARTWIGRLDKISADGHKLLAEEARVGEAIRKSVTEAHTATIAASETRLNKAKADHEALQKELASLRAQPAETRERLAELERERDAAVAKHAEATAKVVAARDALDRTGHAQLLDEFLGARIADDTYRKELTLFSRIRTDFARMSKLMAKADAEFLSDPKKKPPPPVARIVLYIDDLDRCSQKRVIEVLQLVHLLLAFPLFVCVVAVDPTVISQAFATMPGAAKLDDGLGRAYIEKIFQIPLWLRPIDERKTAAVAASFFAKLEADEREYLDKLAPLLDGTPRRLKRFANTYPLVISALSVDELAVFHKSIRLQGRSDDAHYVPFRLCMALLAVLGNPDHAKELAAALDSSRSETAKPDPDKPYVTIERVLGGVSERVRACLGTALDERALEADLETLELWFERTRRYSFYL